MISGIHHLTLITRKVQANVDFYVGFLGLRLVKQTGGFEDAEQLHLFYGDSSGSPGSLITFLVWEDGAAGRVGHGQVSEIALALDPLSIGFWLERALRHQVPVEGPVQEFGETVLRLRDPDGVTVKLVGTKLSVADPWITSDISAQHIVQRVRSATILSEAPEQTVRFIEQYFGFKRMGRDGVIERLVSDTGDAIDIRDASGFWPGVPGTGIADHVAFRAQTANEIIQVEQALSKRNSSPTSTHDRKYFISLYVREPGGTLIELATDGPGFTVDEPLEHLGETLFVPPANIAKAEDIKTMLPQFSQPGEDRVVYRDLPFIHRIHTPDDADGSMLVLLHGTGGNEYDLMPLARRVAPRATLLGVRGRSAEEGVQRWFRRLSMGTFDQADIRLEAEAFAAFIEGAVASYGLNPERTAYLGYSNGANLLAAFLRLHPHIMRKAVLLRAIEVLEQPPHADLSDVEVLLLNGSSDPYSAMAAPLQQALSAGGARMDAHMLAAGHGLTDQDTEIVRDWLAVL